MGDGPGDGDLTPPGLLAALALDVNHVVLVFDEPLSRWSADNPNNYQITGDSPRSTTSSDPATWGVITASLHSDYLTVTLTTDALSDEPYLINVTGVSDIHGNAIVRKVQRPFDGTNIPDTTPAEVVYRSPAPDASGVSTATFVALGFSEAVPPEEVAQGLRVIGDGATLTTLRYDDLLHYTSGVNSLQADASYTVLLTGIEDVAGNIMPDVQWTFETTATDDTTEPTVISTFPAHQTIHVDVTTDLTLTFSEPMSPYSVILRPSVRTGGVQWSHGGRKVRYATDWMPGTQYTVQIRPGEMSDAAGNASTNLFSMTFSTGDALETGSFTGAITGDTGSSRASDPTGGIVFAGVSSPNELYTSVVGFVGDTDGYEVKRLRNGTYYPFYVKDSDGNHIYQPKYGDALGVYGISNWFSTAPPQTVDIGDGTVSGINFRIYDPTAVCGLLLYDGPFFEGTIYVGLFDTDGFDPMTSTPVVATTALRDGRWDYVVNTLDVGPVPDGSYFVAAYLDAESNGVFDPSVDPMGVYGGASPIALHLSRGSDATETSFALNNPAPATAAPAVRWPAAPRSRLLARVVDMLAAQDDAVSAFK